MAPQLELPIGEVDDAPITWATQVHTHPAQMVLKRCGKPAVHDSHPYLVGPLNFGCDGKPPEEKRCPAWGSHDPHVWARSRAGIYDCTGR